MYLGNFLDSTDSTLVISFSNDSSLHLGSIKAKDMMQKIYGQMMFQQEGFIDNEVPLEIHGVLILVILLSMLWAFHL